MALENRTALDAHLKECGARYAKLTHEMQHNHEVVHHRLDGITKIMLSSTVALVGGLFGIIGILLHNGGKF